ncbi:arginine--tRNA ligase domain-containing protein [Saccharothrix syringae]|uniref:Arginine--tRNA ligase n=1 Tax=Saccharothrix syringae TaxID=103733 RepID=A0A5Q0H681_SACSY|nr:arginine--tRNA ligase [Saccharothrix syringae]
MPGGDVGLELGLRVARALKAALDVGITQVEALIRPSAPGRGADYRCNVAMGSAKRLGRAPREVAGPGFVNFTLRRAWLEERTAALLDDPRLGVPTTDAPRRFAVNYGGPNVAKEMHVGHLRSSIIGDAVVRLLEFQGHEVLRHNHLGDWGTPFGMPCQARERGTRPTSRVEVGSHERNLAAVTRARTPGTRPTHVTRHGH